MKILMLINGLYPEKKGGVEKLGADLARHLAKKHEVIVYTSHQGDLPAREIRNDFRIERLKSSWDFKLNAAVGVRTFQILRRLARERKKPDIILSMSLGFSLVSYFAKVLYRIPFIIYVLGSDWNVARDGKLKGGISRMGIEKCDALINQSNIIKNEVLERFPRANVEVIPNGIDLPSKRSRGEKIIFLGRLHPVKGVEYLIEAVRGIENCPELLIGGSGQEEGRLKELARGLNIRFLGSVRDSEALFLQGKFLVLPSLSEGLPQVVLEAMSYGLPVIATRVGGIPEVIAHGETGLLVEPGSPHALRESIARLLQDDAVCHRMSENCLAAIKSYEWGTIVGKFEAVMNRCMDSSRWRVH